MMAVTGAPDFVEIEMLTGVTEAEMASKKGSMHRVYLAVLEALEKELGIDREEGEEGSAQVSKEDSKLEGREDYTTLLVGYGDDSVNTYKLLQRAEDGTIPQQAPHAQAWMVGAGGVAVRWRVKVELPGGGEEREVSRQAHTPHGHARVHAWACGSKGAHERISTRARR